MRIIWKTDEKLMNEFDVANNIEVTTDAEGYLSIRIIRAVEGEEPIALTKALTTIDAIELGVALIRATGRNER